jgi:hypothetical protein
MPNKAGTQVMLGKAYFRQLIPLRKTAVGKWAMVMILTYGRIIGWLGKMGTRSSLLGRSKQTYRKSMSFSQIPPQKVGTLM